MNIRLAGAVKDSGVDDADSRIYAIVPEDYPGFSSKVDVHPGDTVKVGSKILHDKHYPEICLVSPVSGTVKDVVRGERRRVLRVEIESDGLMSQVWGSRKESFKDIKNTGDVKDLTGHSPVGVVPTLALLCRAGLFAQMRRRPFDMIPRPDVRPRDIFVTAFDTAPLSTPLYDRISAHTGARKILAAAVSALKPLTDGNIYISADSSWPFGEIEGAETVEVNGPHPAGNVGIQIANIAPVNKGDEVWTMDLVTLFRIGRLLAEGFLDTSAVVALTGPEVERPCLLHTYEGARIEDLTAGRLKPSDHHIRIISGNVLTGTAVGKEGFLRFPWRQVTVIAEGDDTDELLGWASMSPGKLSVSRSFPLSRLRRVFSPDARLGGARRAMILSGEYCRVMPADIMVEYLVKAILSHNIEDMEALGIYEIAPEDVALCEFVDPSKLPLQQIVRDGLDFMYKES